MHKNAVERPIILMERSGGSMLTQELLIDGLVQTYEENLVVDTEKKKIGLL